MNIEKLSVGSHKSVEKGACVMELVSLLANEPWSDRPACASASITSWCIWINDSGDQAHRDILLSLAPQIVGTRDWKKEPARAALFSDFAQDMAKYAAEYAEYAAKYAKYAAESAAEYARSAKYAAESAAEYAEYAARSAEYAESAAESAAKSAEYAESAAKSAAFRKTMFDQAIEVLKKCLAVGEGGGG
jgi:hypothetical protein